MNWKIITSILVTGLLTFALGWFLHGVEPVADSVTSDERVDSLQKTDTQFVTITQGQLDSLMMPFNPSGKETNYSTKISGQFVLKGTNCAGLNFINSKLVSWTNEIDCWHPDTLKIRWIDNKTFFTRAIVRRNEICPPGVDLYQVVSFDGERLVLKDIWTGWNDFTDDRLEFVRREIED